MHDTADDGAADAGFEGWRGERQDVRAPPLRGAAPRRVARSAPRRGCTGRTWERRGTRMGLTRIGDF